MLSTAPQQTELGPRGPLLSPLRPGPAPTSPHHPSAPKSGYPSQASEPSRALAGFPDAGPSVQAAKEDMDKDWDWAGYYILAFF